VHNGRAHPHAQWICTRACTEAEAEAFEARQVADERREAYEACREAEAEAFEALQVADECDILSDAEPPNCQHCKQCQFDSTFFLPITETRLRKETLDEEGKKQIR
jgi:hypothetical protein